MNKKFNLTEATVTNVKIQAGIKLLLYKNVVHFQMEKARINHQKKMARYRYQDMIYKMHQKGKAVSEITKNINFRLARTKLKVQLSETTIRNIIKELKEKRKDLV